MLAHLLPSSAPMSVLPVIIHEQMLDTDAPAVVWRRTPFFTIQLWCLPVPVSIHRLALGWSCDWPDTFAHGVTNRA